MWQIFVRWWWICCTTSCRIVVNSSVGVLYNMSVAGVRVVEFGTYNSTKLTEAKLTQLSPVRRACRRLIQVYRQPFHWEPAATSEAETRDARTDAESRCAAPMPSGRRRGCTDLPAPRTIRTGISNTTVRLLSSAWDDDNHWVCRLNCWYYL